MAGEYLKQKEGEIESQKNNKTKWQRVNCDESQRNGAGVIGCFGPVIGTRTFCWEIKLNQWTVSGRRLVSGLYDVSQSAPAGIFSGRLPLFRVGGRQDDEAEKEKRKKRKPVSR